MAQGLIRKYESEGRAIDLEAVGLPSTTIDSITVDAGSGDGASHIEWESALRDIDRDLDGLAVDHRLKDIDIELNAWGTSIRRILGQGAAAAALALDPRMRDTTQAARRSLGEYARLARCVGALSSGVNLEFRQLAQSLDVCASLLLVLMGETLALAGSRAGQFLLQAPASELQARRDAVLVALRNLTGSVQESYSSQEWPRGLEGYRELLRELNEGGHADLRVLFNEDTLTQQLNDLVDLSSGSNVNGLRSLGATAHVALQRFRRVLQLGQFLVTPESPPLSAFFSAIRLFLNAFESTGSGSRLLYVARPPILFYGHYGIGGPSVAVRRLLRIIALRSRLAEEIDCYANCLCESDEIACLVRLDKILFDVDRAIDLYTLGSDPNGYGEPEQRAAAYGAVIESYNTRFGCDTQAACGNDEITDVLGEIQDSLGFDSGGGRIPDMSLPSSHQDAVICRMNSEICIQLGAEALWEELVRRMAPGCRQAAVFGCDGSATVIESLLDDPDGGALQLIRGLNDTHDCTTCDAPDVGIPPHFETSLEVITHDVTRRGRFRRSGR